MKNSPTNNLNNYSVLIVDDEEVNYLFIKTVIESEIDPDYTILYAENGKLAIDICKSKVIDLILMDLKMPVMDGFKASEIIKKDYPIIPIIAQTAYTSEEVKVKASNCGIDKVITKPISVNILKDVFNKYNN